ncbi:type VI secretion protein [Agarivorans sp. Toyoura001]|uniref:type VI secretion system protein TssA n=1 Tax=Agarivorans sp. Toyoura001 TaxID=2283141 RepID=UPI0010EF0C4D|nr:type VI secretion system protein TssA [Agarivorans sp. Toyoura001]GDY25311.1 type VI secretion protein [Agarivorans sp. Toyoura001]
MFLELTDIDFEQLAQPLSDEQPCGEDPRLDASPMSTYFTLKDVRNTARAAERNALVDNEPLLSFANEWDPIVNQVPEVLVENCKDLELAAWLIEGLVRRKGFKGLRQGFDIARTLIENHWDNLYPSPDEDGVVTRVAPLVGLNGYDGEGTLLMPIACVPLTDLIDVQPYSLWEFEQASEVERLEEKKRTQRHNSGAVRLEDITNTVKATSGAFFVELLQDIELASEAYKKLSAAMDEAVGEPQPSSHIIKRLTDCIEAVRYLAADKLSAAEAQASIEEILEESDEQPSDAEAVAGPSNQLRNRADAIQQLGKIAEFFKETEPHSPMAYAIEQVVRWSGMNLPDLLQELISDNDARTGYFRLTGISSESQD